MPYRRGSGWEDCIGLKGEWLGLLSLSRFPSGGETRSQVHLVNAAPLLELRCPLLHLVERLRSGGKMSACRGPSPQVLSNSPGEVRLNSMVTRGADCEYLDTPGWLLG